MNWFVLGAGIFAAFTVIGHFTMGSKNFLNPMLQASFDNVAKKVMHCVFHYISAFLILSAVALFLVGFGVLSDSQLLVRFISINYAAFGLWQIYLALTSDIEKGVLKMFQWIFFLIIAGLAWLGA
jgi:hypothetical protein